MGGSLLVWLGSPNSAGRAPFGAVASEAALIVAMGALALAMPVLAFAARLRTVVLRAWVTVVSLPVAALGALAIGSLFSDPGGPFILLTMAWVLSVLVLLAVSRASTRRAR